MNQLRLDLGSAAEVEPLFPLACGEQPQARLENFGVAALSDTELLALIIQGGAIRAERAMAIASRLLSEASSISGLVPWHQSDYRRIRGISKSKGLQLAAIAEIARRMMKAPPSANVMCNRAETVASLFWPMTAGLQVEKFWVLCLNRKNRLMKVVEISSGTATAALAHPREVFREAIRHGAAAIACAHNHPSGDPAPSAPDLHVTRQLREAARTLDIDFIDHVIVGLSESDPANRGYFSFKEAGLL